MAVKLGSADVSFRLGATTPAAVYLGSEQVWSAVTVPGAPTVLSAAEFEGTGCGNAEWTAPESDGGSAITAWRLYLNGSFAEEITNDPPASSYSGCSGGLFAGGSWQVSAVNAVGEGPKSDPFTVTAA